MPEKLHDEPAAPQTMSHHTFTRLELDDFFAAHALQGMLANEFGYKLALDNAMAAGSLPADTLAGLAYNYASAMLAERQRRKERSEA